MAILCKFLKHKYDIFWHPKLSRQRGVIKLEFQDRCIRCGDVRATFTGEAVHKTEEEYKESIRRREPLTIILKQ